MRFSTPLLLCATALISLPVHPANAALLIGSACDNFELGTTKMDNDDVNLVACVCKNPNCAPAGRIWKGMSNSNNIICPNPADGIIKTITSIINGVATCTVPKNSDISCPTGQAMTAIVGGVPTCTAGAATPKPPPPCPGKSVPLNACPTYYEDRWGHSIANGSAGSMYVAQSGTGATASSTWSCSETTWQYPDYWVTVNYTGSVICMSGTWNCTIYQSFPFCSIKAGCNYPAQPSVILNGPC